MLDPSGISHDILSRSTIARYMRAHFERWMEFANSRFGLGLKDEELLAPMEEILPQLTVRGVIAFDEYW